MVDPITAGASIISLGLSIFGANEAEKAAKEAARKRAEAARLGQTVNTININLQALELVRRARQAQAMALNEVAFRGVGAESSGVQAAQSVAKSQITSKVNRARHINEINQQITNLGIEANSLDVKAAKFNTLSDLGFNLFSTSGGFQTLGDITKTIF